MADWVREYITQAGKDVVADILIEKIIEQKERMVEYKNALLRRRES